MNPLSRHHFINNRAFETYHLDREDQAALRVAECDVLGFRYASILEGVDRMVVLRPDEALIMARMLIDAVAQVTEGYVTVKPEADNL